MQFSKASPLKSGESSEKSSGENRVKSCHVCDCHVFFFGPENWRPLVPAIPQSEVLAKFFEEIGEILAKFFADFRPSISRENGCKKFHEKSATFSTVHQLKFFHCCHSGGLGAQRFLELAMGNASGSDGESVDIFLGSGGAIVREKLKGNN